MMKDFENKMLKCVLTNPKIIQNHIDIFRREGLFLNTYNKYIVRHLIEYLEKYNEVPTIDFLCDKIITENGDDSKTTKIILDHIEMNIDPIQLTEGEIKYLEDNIKLKLKDNILTKAQEKVGKLEPEQIEKVLEDVAELSQNKLPYITRMLWDDIDNEIRQPIPTGLELIDKYGIAKGEIGVILAGTGVGKSVILTFMANNFMLGGYKVLHIVFEGNINTYHRLHLKKLNNPSKDKLIRGKTIPNLKVIQLKSNDTTTKDIEKLINEHINNDFVPDMIVLDYVDCLVGNGGKEIWQNDIKIINELEHICQKYQVGLWTAIQANRSGVNKELTIENVSGSIQKAQKASLVLALTRNLDQEQNNTADVRILKNRFGAKEMSLNCVWNPNEMNIELPITEDNLL